MYSYVFIDPTVISEAAAAGPMGLGRLVEVILGFEKDCLIAETDCWRIETEIGECVRAITEGDNTKRLKEVLIRSWKKGPRPIINGDEGNKSLWDFAKENAEAASLDFLLSSEAQGIIEENNWEASGLSELHETKFAEKRINCTNGASFDQGAATFTEVFNQCFEKLVRHSENVIFTDYALGAYLSGSQYHNLKEWIRKLRDTAPSLCSVEIRTVKPTTGLPSLNTLVEELRNEVNFRIKLDLYDSKDALPHNRYLQADQRRLDIDRGIDLCCEENKVRSIRIAFA